MFRKKKVATTVSLMTAASMVLLSGCSGTEYSKIEAMNQTPMATQSEIIDYYAEEMKIGSMSTRTVESNKQSWIEYDVPNETATLLAGKVQDIEGMLTQEYEVSPANEKRLPEDVYYYIKTSLNDKAIQNGNIESVKGAMGFYFVDVKYDLTGADYGPYTNKTNLLGLHGAFVHSADQKEVYTSWAYLESLEEGLNEYYESLGSTTKLVLDRDNKVLTIESNEVDDLADNSLSMGDESEGYSEEDFIVDEEVRNQSVGETEEISDEEESEAESETEASSEEDSEEKEEDEDEDEEEELPDYIKKVGVKVDEEGEAGEVKQGQVQGDTVITIDTTAEEMETVKPLEDKNDRTNKLDVRLANSKVGSSETQAQFMPPIDMVYQRVDAGTTNIAGIGIAPGGLSGLQEYGFDRGQISGSADIRYVFKEALDGSNSIICTNAYITHLELFNGIGAVDGGDVLIPDFLQTEIETLIEKGDRAVIDCDLSALVGNTIFKTIDRGVLTGFENEHTYVARNDSTLKRVINRDIANNRYLLEVVTEREDGARAGGHCGTYRDTYYIAVEYRNGGFLIADSELIKREMIAEPEIKPDSAAERRLVATNLAGEVKDAEKAKVQELFREFYACCTNKIANKPEEPTTVENAAGQQVEITRGMLNCLETNSELLPTRQKDYMVSKVSTKIAAYGNDTKCNVNGKVAEWIGGSNNQVELIMEEYYNYAGYDVTYVNTTYYLVSALEDEWKIDNMKVLSEEELTGAEAQTAMNRINQQ